MAGMQKFHPNQTLNFLANRMAVDIASSEIAEFTNNIAGIDDWVDSALSAAKDAESNKRYRQAGAYFRAAEFYMAPDHPDKQTAYDRFLTNFDSAFPEVAFLRAKVPYEGSELSVIDMPAAGKAKGVILLCSGFDGLIEEIYDPLRELTRNGYRVVLFEGPGQGAALRRSHLPMIFDWERPVASILDHLQIDDCTLIGWSLGGYLAPRAAAFEPRVKRLVAWGAMYKFIECFRKGLGDEAFNGLMQLMDDEQEDVVNQLLTARMNEDVAVRWSITHGIHTCDGKTPYGFLQWVRSMDLEPISDKITQDTLILHGNRDHLSPVDQVWAQAAALTNASSTTVRIFTDQDNAAEHAQVTNVAAGLRVILDWLDAMQAKSEL